MRDFVREITNKCQPLFYTRTQCDSLCVRSFSSSCDVAIPQQTAPNRVPPLVCDGHHWHRQRYAFGLQNGQLQHRVFDRQHTCGIKVL